MDRNYVVREDVDWIWLFSFMKIMKSV